MGVAHSGLWSPDFNTEYLHSLLLFNRLSNCLFLSLRHRRNQTLVKSVCETAPEPCSGSPSVYQDLSTRLDWPDIKAIVDLAMRLKRNSKRTSGNSLSPLGTQNKDIGAVSQTLLTKVKLRLRRRLPLL